MTAFRAVCGLENWEQGLRELRIGKRKTGDSLRDDFRFTSAKVFSLIRVEVGDQRGLMRAVNYKAVHTVLRCPLSVSISRLILARSLRTSEGLAVDAAAPPVLLSTGEGFGFDEVSSSSNCW